VEDLVLARIKEVTNKSITQTLITCL